MPVLRILNDKGGEIRRLLPDDLAGRKHISVGRSGDCSVCLKNLPGVGRTVGSHHLSLTRQQDDWWVVDAGSTGIAKAGKRVHEARLGDSDRIKFGSCFLVVGDEVGLSPYSLFYEPQIGHIQSEPLWMGRNWIGKSSKNTIKIQDVGSCSRRHACITVERQGFALEDLGSSNGTRVNGKRITKPTRISCGDSFQIGKSRAWIDLNANSEKHFKENTLLKNRYFRLLLLLLIILALMLLRSCLSKPGPKVAAARLPTVPAAWAGHQVSSLNGETRSMTSTASAGNSARNGLGSRGLDRPQTCRKAACVRTTSSLPRVMPT